MDQSNALESLKQNLQKLSAIPAEELFYLQSCAEFVSIPAKTVLIKQGTPPNRLYFVYKGLLKQHFIESNGKEAVKTFIWENQLCANYSAILTNRLANFQTTALEECQLLAIGVEKLSSLYQRHPCWQEVGRKVAEGLLIAKELREQQMLTLNAEERYLEFQRHFSHLMNRLPQYEIASYVGITPVALSQIRQKIARHERG